MSESVPQIVFTGGPCAGKSSALAIVMQKLADYGIIALAVPEVATSVFGSGFRIGDILGNNDLVSRFQQEMIRTQLRFEEVWQNFACIQPGDKKVLLCDRGVMDNKAYVRDPLLFDAMVQDMGFRLVDLRDRRYDAVMHLVTAADGAEEFYNLDNPARHETPEQARILDRKTLAAWNGHEHLRVIGNFELGSDGVHRPISFERKMEILLQEVCHALHIPVPLEIERRFLVPLSVNPAMFPVHVVQVPIEQEYLQKIEPEVTRRARARRYGMRPEDGVLYIYTEKRYMGSGVSAETERIVSAREYYDLLAQRDPESNPIRKTRHAFVWKDQYFQLDVLSEPFPIILLEVELTKDRTNLMLPPFLDVVKEITDDRRFSNASIAAGKCPGYS